MFGSGNEPSTVEEFEALFPNDYYPYNDGELVSFNGTGIKTVGFNAFNVDTGKAELLGGNQYQISGKYTSVSYVDIDGNSETLTISSGLFTPNKNGTLTVVGGNNTTCVHLTWSGYRNGEYEPYWDYTRNFPISSIMYSGSPLFPNGLCGMEKAADTITPNKAIKSLDSRSFNGTENWTLSHNETTGNYTYSLESSNIFGSLDFANAGRYGNLSSYIRLTINKGYNAVRYQSDATLRKDKDVYAYNGNRLSIIDNSCTTVEAFKTKLANWNSEGSPLKIISYLKNDIEVDLVGVNLSYKVADFGTEEIVPQGVDDDGVPLTSPFVGDIIYSTDFTRQLVNMPKNYQSQDSMDAALTALGTALGFTWSKTFDTTNQKWNYVVTPNTPES